MPVLSGCQATLQTTGTTVIAVTALAGFALVEDRAMATVPLTCCVLGSALSTIPASLLMNAIGRMGGFQVGAFLGMLGAAIRAIAMYVGSFWLLCAGVTVLGINTAFVRSTTARSRSCCSQPPQRCG